MNCLGMRCSNNDYTFAIIGGKKKNPILIDKGTIDFPKGFSRAASLRWFFQEVEEIFKKHNINIVAIKGAEAMATRNKTFVERVENEAIIFLVAENHGIKKVRRKLKSTIAKDLGLKGKAKYLSTHLDTTIFKNFDNETAKTQEAILVAWSSIK